MGNQIQVKEMTNDQLLEMLQSIQEELNEREWDSIVAKPHIMKRMIELAREAQQEHLEGKTIEGGFGDIA